MRNGLSLAIGAIVIAFCVGCSGIGPQAISANRVAYNSVVQQTNDQELLLNIVRIRFRDTLYFTNVEKIAATHELNRGLGASGTVTSTSNSIAAPQPLASTNSALSRVLSQSFTMGPGTLAVNDKPTIFYAPVDGERFVRQMMTPMNPDLIWLLIKSGWSIDRVLTVAVQELNGLQNAPTASGPAPSHAPEFRDFREAVRLLRVLQREGLLVVRGSPGTKGIELRFVREGAGRPETRRFKELAGVAEGGDVLTLTLDQNVAGLGVLRITTRPMLAALHYLATGVEVSEKELREGRVRRTVNTNGTPFDWQELLSGVFRVRHSATEPEGASVSLHYRGAWYFIADDDLDSKSTFVLLTQLMALHATPSGVGAPQLSYSLGR